MATTTMSRPSTRARDRNDTIEVVQTTRTVVPRVDIYETDTAYLLLADMPGVASGGLEVTADRDELTIRGHVEPAKHTPDHQEFELADYHRIFVLTEDLDTASITATLKDGVLRVEVPKHPRLQPKKISVRAE
jgi:HSP20 family molecular chaperone IbpA